jgi:uncharacterized protein YegL
MMSKGENTLIQVILDKSGSMAGQTGDTLKGINHFISEHRTNVPEARFSLTLFDTTFNLLLADVPMSEVKDLTEKDYQAGGGTALLDAVGATIMPIENLGDRFEKVHVVILTDGEENSSQDFTYEAVKDKVEWHQNEGKGWEFTFIGANIDSYAQGGAVGFAAAGTMNYNQTRAGTQAVFNTVTASSVGYTTGTRSSTAYSDEEREKVENTK